MTNLENLLWKEHIDFQLIKQQSDEKKVEKTEILKVSKTKIPNFVQQNSPVNNELIRNKELNDLYNTENTDKKTSTEVVVREKHGKIAPIHTLCSFYYDNSVDLEILNKNGRFKITGYDRRVYNAIGTLWLNERKTISLTEIFAVMNGYKKGNPSAKQLEAVEKSLNKLRSIMVRIDLTAEVKANIIKDKKPLIEAGILKNNRDKIKSVIIEDNMLHFRAGTITSESGNIFKGIQIIAEPSLLTYNRIKGTLISIPMQYIGLDDSKATEKTIAFQDYLLMRIMGYKNNHLIENKILYNTIYRDSGIEKPESRSELKRDREIIQKIMEEWVKKDLITSYEEIKEEFTYYGIIFYTEKFLK